MMLLKQLHKIISQKKNKIQSKANYLDLFFNNPNHHWIRDHHALKRSFTILLNSMDNQLLELFTKTYPTYFISCNSLLSCAIGKTGHEQLILVFPDLHKRLLSAQIYQGIAVLAHELGHIYHQHTEKKIDSLKAQIEADNFALKLGFGEELQEVLLEHAGSIDCRVRISNLTAQLIEKKFYSN